MSEQDDSISRQPSRAKKRPDERKKIALIAQDALMQYNPDAIKINMYEEIYVPGGGTIFMFEFVHKDNATRFEWPVLVRWGRATVFTSFEELVKREFVRRTLLQWCSFYDVVIALISLGIVVVSFIFFFRKNHDFPPMLGNAFAIVLGFWFGKQAGQANRNSDSN